MAKFRSGNSGVTASVYPATLRREGVRQARSRLGCHALSHPLPQLVMKEIWQMAGPRSAGCCSNDVIDAARDLEAVVDIVLRAHFETVDRVRIKVGGLP